MKIRLTIFAIIISGSCIAQTYTPFPIGTGYWKYYGTYHEYGAYAVSNIQLTSTTEAVVYNGKTYYKVKTRISSDGGGSGFPPPPDDIADATDNDYIAIREQDKRVYMEYNGLGEYVLFDFNLSVGDMMPLVNSGRLYGAMSTEFSQQYSRINSIDKVTVQDAVTGNTKELKRYNLDNTASVVEGIGGSFGLFLYTRSYDARTLSYTCSNPGLNSCSYVWPYGTALSVNAKLLRDCSIYPNPFSNQLCIDDLQNGTVYLYNLSGQLILSESINDRHTAIATATLPTGVYLLRALDASGQIVRRQQIVRAN